MDRMSIVIKKVYIGNKHPTVEHIIHILFILYSTFKNHFISVNAIVDFYKITIFPFYVLL